VHTITAAVRLDSPTTALTHTPQRCTPAPHPLTRAAPRTAQLRHLIACLLVKDVTKRLGCLRGGAGDVKAHRFFRGLDWEALTRKAVRPPWVPSLRGATDTSCFDEYDEDDPPLSRARAALLDLALALAPRCPPLIHPPSPPPSPRPLPLESVARGERRGDRHRC